MNRWFLCLVLWFGSVLRVGSFTSWCCVVVIARFFAFMWGWYNITSGSLVVRLGFGVLGFWFAVCGCCLLLCGCLAAYLRVFRLG